MAIILNTGFLKTIPGIFKIVEFALALTILLIARLGIQESQYKHLVDWGRNTDLEYLGIGTFVGFSIIIPTILLTYLMINLMIKLC